MDHARTTVDRLRRALAHRRLELRYQPVVALGDGHVDELRALLRWPSGGGLGPEDVMELAQHGDLLDSVEAWILREACVEAAGWVRRGDESVVGVTLAAAPLRGRRVLPAVDEALRSSGLPPDALRIEIPVQALPAPGARVDPLLPGLRALGVRLGVVGVRRWPVTTTVVPDYVDRISVDRRMVAMLGETVTAPEVVEAVVRIARDPDLTCVAVGIETDRQLARVRALGMSHGQGYWFAPPTRGADLPLLLSRMATLTDRHRTERVPWNGRIA